MRDKAVQGEEGQGEEPLDEKVRDVNDLRLDQGLSNLIQSLSPNGFILARLATGCDEAALNLVSLSQHRLARLQGSALLDPRQMFFRGLESDIQDWLWWKRVKRRYLRMFRPARLDQPQHYPEGVHQLANLPVLRQQAYLLQKLESYSFAEIADILGCSLYPIRHPLYPYAPGGMKPTAAERSDYRQQLRVSRHAIKELPALLTPSLKIRLNQSREQALRRRLPVERQALYLWQQAMKRSLMPTGLSLLAVMVVAFLLMLL